MASEFPDPAVRRHRRLQEIFQIALKLPDEERRAFLSKDAGEDAELYSEVRRLLAADEADDDFLETPILSEVVPSADRRGTDKPVPAGQAAERLFRAHLAQRAAEGRTVDIDRLCAEHPDLAAPLRLLAAGFALGRTWPPTPTPLGRAVRRWFRRGTGDT